MCVLGNCKEICHWYRAAGTSTWHSVISRHWPWTDLGPGQMSCQWST